MVHALEAIHRLLKPAGSLIDIHPFAEAPQIEVHRGGKIIFAEPIPAYDYEDMLQAEEALAQVIQRRLFFVECTAMFDFLIYGSSIAELCDFLDEASAYNECPSEEAEALRNADLSFRVEEVMLAAGEAAEVVSHERAHIAKLRPAGPARQSPG